MGVPAFFRWLSKKFPSIVVHCVEETAKTVDGVTIPVDASLPNPNNFEFDNLYLDMNGIIHPCCHPENKPAPKNEDEMMELIFEYIDRLFAIVRPRRLLYMAIDGVAPRAKMNQQRSRRFRASKETMEKSEEIKSIREQLSKQGAQLPQEKAKGEHFDSNCITPGTPFMDRLATCLDYYIHARLNTDPGWRGLEVILSDANVPGEGEHKIMNYIRKQRAAPGHDPNTSHCLCGADADLIMLGLATHEPNFTIIREEFKPNQPRPCEVCNQVGHEMKECIGLALEDSENRPPPTMGSETEFIYIRLNVLREYLAEELALPNLPFPFDLERAIDDWVFMCFFVGNDFLPHLPSLEIREGAIDRLVGIYKKIVCNTGGFITNSGFVEMDSIHLIMGELGQVEDQVFKKRQQNELSFKKREQDKRKRTRLMNDRPSWMPTGQYSPMPVSRNPHPIQSPRYEAYQMRMQGPSATNSPQQQTNINKRKSEILEEVEEPEHKDDVRLWEAGWKDRYYMVKFEVAANNFEFRHQVARAYVEGLCWVLRYYYQGCASWNWYFPYHYAPFASDFVGIKSLKISLEMGAPFKPLEQLMSVFPAASKQHLPDPWARLMHDPQSSIIDFYPTDFKVDLNGKKYAWQGVALLPFVDEDRLHAALESVYPLLTPDEIRRNVRGDDKLYVRQSHSCYEFLLALYTAGKDNESLDIDSSLTHGMSGLVLHTDQVIPPNTTVHSPLPNLDSVLNNQVVCVKYRDPFYPDDFVFPATRLEKAVDPPKVLKPKALRDNDRGRGWNPQIGMAPSQQRASLSAEGGRMLNHSLAGPYSNMPPPNSLNRRDGYNRGGSHDHRGNTNIFNDSQGRGGYSSNNHRNNSSSSGGGYNNHRGDSSSRGGGYNNHRNDSSSRGGGYNNHRGDSSSRGGRNENRNWNPYSSQNSRGGFNQGGNLDSQKQGRYNSREDLQGGYRSGGARRGGPQPQSATPLPNAGGWFSLDMEPPQQRAVVPPPRPDNRNHEFNRR